MSIYCFGEDDDKKQNNSKKKRVSYNKNKESEYYKHKDNGGKNHDNSEIIKKLNEIKLDTDNIKILEYRQYDEEIDYGNIEYKLKLNNISEKRIEKLTTQMQFRLTEGNGECFYQIGVEDNGNPIGISKDELEDSIKVLCFITQKIGAQMTILNYRDGINGLIGEILIIKEEKIKSKLEIKIGLIGEEQCGKSSLVGVLVTDKLDNGSGLASKNVFRHKHEVICGKTSSFTHQILGLDEKGKMTNQSFFGKLSWPEIVDKSAKVINFYDLGGSEKALKLSIKALSPNYLDYLSIVISASSGITNNTLIFLKMAFAMDLPVIIIVTKIDLLAEEDETSFFNNLNYYIKAQKCNRNALRVKTEEDIVLFSRMLKENIVPIFMVSNKSGIGLGLFTNFLNLLPTNLPEEKNSEIQFDIHSIINKDNKTILAGIVSQGTIDKNRVLFIGPDNKNIFNKVTVKSIHCKKIDVKKAFKGQYCTLEVDIKESEVRKGMVIVDSDLSGQSCKSFIAELWNLSSKEVKVIENKTQFVISSGHIRQEAIVKSIQKNEDKEKSKEESIINDKLESKDEAEGVFMKLEEPVTMQIDFRFNCELLKEGSHLVIMDSNIKCFGVVKKILL